MYGEYLGLIAFKLLLLAVPILVLSLVAYVVIRVAIALGRAARRRYRRPLTPHPGN